MRKFLLSLLFVLSPFGVGQAFAQVIPSYNYPSAGTPPAVQLQCSDTYTNCLPVTSTNPVKVSVTTSGTPQQVIGDSAAGAADSGTAPVKIGGLASVAFPTLVTAGQRVNGWFGRNGALVITAATMGGSDGQNNATIGLISSDTASNNAGPVGIAGFSYNATGWDRARTIQGADGTGLGVAAVATAPQSNANGAIAANASAAVEGSHVAKASAGNFYRVAVTAGASAGFLMGFNATSAPVDGAVTPVICVPVAANGYVTVDRGNIPDRYGTGITFVFSTTGCFTKTISATAYFTWSVM